MSKSFKYFVLFCFLIVVGFIITAPQSGVNLHKARAIKLGNNGRQIFLAVFEKSIEAHEAGTGETFFPQAGEYESSTEYFRAMVTNNWIKGIDYSFFERERKAGYDYEDPALFTGDHNAWCVVVGVDENTPAGVPFIFTRNIGFGPGRRSPISGTSLSLMTGLNKKEMPFGNKICVVITKGGAVKVLNKKEARQEVFNPEGSTLKILVP